MTILSIDDSLMVRKIISYSGGFIEGLNVLEAEDGKDGLKKIEKNEIDLFIIDIKMPEMNGIDFIKKLRKNKKYKQTPVIILSTDTKEDCNASGIDTQGVLINEWIQKPVSVKELKQIISKYSK